jgi:hypothetical protein
MPNSGLELRPMNNKILEQAAAKSCGLTGLEEAEVLDQIGHALQRPVGKPRRDCFARLLILFMHNRIDGRVDLLGPCDRRFQHLLGADLALGDEFGERDGVVFAIFVEPHGRQISNIKAR